MQAAQGGIARYAGAVDAGPDDQEVTGLCGHAPHSAPARHKTKKADRSLPFLKPAPKRRSVTLAQFLDRCELGNGRSQFGLGCGVVHAGIPVGQRFFSQTLGFCRLGLVQIGTANGGIGQHGHQTRLHFEQAAGNENQFFLA
jgi:hypothetical protein